MGSQIDHAGPARSPAPRPFAGQPEGRGRTRYTVATARDLSSESPVDHVVVTGDTILIPGQGARNTIPLVVMDPHGRPAAVFAAGLWRWAAESETHTIIEGTER